MMAVNETALIEPRAHVQRRKLPGVVLSRPAGSATGQGGIQACLASDLERQMDLCDRAFVPDAGPESCARRAHRIRLESLPAREDIEPSGLVPLVR